LLAVAGIASAQTELAVLVETPAVTGHEQALAEKIRERARAAGYTLEQDNLGNLWVTLGSGAPHRLIVAPLDEPGYVVSHITADGYLRVQRLPQFAPHPLFDQLHAAQPVQVGTRTGKWIPGVVAGLSTHLQGGRRDPPRVTHLDEMFVDIGARSAEEVRAAGVELLDPIALERELHTISKGFVAGMAVGDRYGVAALLELLRRIDRGRLRGTVTIAFAAQQLAGSRGLDRLLQHIRADEMIYVGRMRAPRGAAQVEPGAGVLLGVARDGEVPAGFAAELAQLAAQHNVPLRPTPALPLPRASYTQGPQLPERLAHLAIPISWPVTPAELTQLADLWSLRDLLQAYTEGRMDRAGSGDIEPGIRSDSPIRPRSSPAMPDILRRLIETYGVSGYEAPVQEAVKSLLPPWARPELDDAGNLLLRVGKGGGPRIVFVAHSDEIGFHVESIAEDGRLVVRPVGGMLMEYFAGRPVLVHTASGRKPGIIELPNGWDAPDFAWPRGAQVRWRVDVGARSPAEVEEVGIKAGDSLTVPKKYRPLYGTRAMGRSFDDRVGCAALIAAAWALGGELADRDVTFAWVTEEEVGLRGAFALAERMAAAGRPAEYVFAVDTFVSSDSPLETPRFGYGRLGEGFVIRAVDNSNIVRRELVDRVVALARENGIPVQFGVTGGGNDGAVFLRHGAHDIPISWPLRYSHSPGEMIDVRDAEALARIVEALARRWAP
jgi:putative aminopeptidase FrvX